MNGIPQIWCQHHLYITLFSVANPTCNADKDVFDNTIVIIENSPIQLQCVVTYRGSMIPIFRWITGRHNRSETGNITEADIEGTKVITSTMLITASAENSFKQCLIQFEPSSNQVKHFNLVSAPDYTYVWGIPAMSYLCELFTMRSGARMWPCMILFCGEISRHKHRYSNTYIV